VLAIAVGGAVALLVPSVLVATVDAPAVVVLAGVAIVVAAVVVLSSHCAASVPRARALRPRTADEALSFLSGWVTDPLHNPLRPRAPGLV
jgi:hypothetical protein